MHLDPITLTAVVLITAICVCGQQMVDDIDIHTTPQYIDGSTYQITCEYSDATYTFRHWDHPDPDVTDITVTTGRFEILRPRAGVHRLIISGTSENDAGEYKCVFARNSNQQLVFTSIVVEYREAIVFNTEDLLSYPRQAGEEATLRCDAENVIDLYWLFDCDGIAVNIEPTADGRIQRDGNNLVFRELLLSDSGTYCCVAVNDLGQMSIQAHLFVFREPSVVVNPMEHLVNRSDSALFVCKVEGSPLPTVQWAFADSSREFRFIDGKISKTEEILNGYTIELRVMFHSVTDEDAAMYRCSAQNNNGSTSELASLQIYTEGAPSAPRQVTVTPVNHTAITVSWLPPEMDASQQITTYTVTVQATNSSISDPPHMATVDRDTTRVVVVGLARLTNHIIFVYAINHIGRGRDSNIVTITTDPSVPAAVVEATFADVSPTSVLALWALPERDPGAPITEVLIQYRNVDIGETWDQARSITVNDISNESSNITGLSPRTQYQLQVTPGNWIGLGEPVATPTFRTQPPGFPGSVHQLSAKNISTNQLALCWVASSTGAHTEYYIKAISLNVTVENRTWIFSVGNSGLMRFSNGTEAAVLDGLDTEACYNFTVTLRNEQGLGLVSPSSGPICTSRVQPCVFDGCPPIRELPTDPEPSRLDFKIIAVVVVCSILGIVLLLLVLVLFVWKITRQRNEKDTYPLSEKSFSRVSSRSDRGSDPEVQAMSFNRQSSIGNTSSLSAGVSYSDQDTPNTGSTLLPDQNPFHFTPSASVNTTLEYPQPAFGHTPNGSLNHAASYPIHGQSHVHWTGLGGVRNAHYPQPDMMPSADLEDVQMVDNPLNPQFEEEKQAQQLWGTPAQQSGYSVADTTDLDSLSVDSSLPPLPAYLGESYSQPSPRLQHRQPSPHEREAAGSEAEEDLEFTENQAYEDVSPKGERRRFQITSQERGAVFETVQFRKA